jgi:hypothetical protein
MGIHFGFGVSRCTRDPFDVDLPSVHHDDGPPWNVVYTVDAPVPWTQERLIFGSGDADYAADLVVQCLPKDGHPFIGDVRGLAKQIADREGLQYEDVWNRLCPPLGTS